MEKKEFEFSASPAAAGATAPSDHFSSDDFRFVQLDKSIHEQRFQGRSTTYLKDIVRRFVKNKTSVFGFCLFGLILLLAICFAIFLPGNADKNAPTPGEQYLPPKLFPAGTGFWDGTRTYTKYLYDESTGLPVLGSLNSSAILDGTTKTYAGTYDNETPYGHGGYVMVGNGAWIASPKLDFSVTGEGDEAAFTGDYSVTFTELRYGLDSDYTDTPTFNIIYQPVDSSGNTMVNVSLAQGLTIDNSLDTVTIDITDYLENVPTEDVMPQGRILIQASGSPIYFEGISLSSSEVDWTGADIDDASADLMITKNNESGTSQTTTEEETVLAAASTSAIDSSNWWTRSSQGAVHAYQVNVTYCDFVYDPYAAIYGETKSTVSSDNLNSMKNEGIITFETDSDGVMILDTLQILDEEHNYIVVGDSENFPMSVVKRTGLAGTTWSLECYVYNYKTPTYGYTHMPIHVFGTDVNGLDMLKLVSIGMLYSLLIGVAVSAICFCIGLAWGSFSGYQGGLIDLGMERVVDILSYIPGMVIITLFILNWGHTFWVFMLAMCVTGWIGTSALTRTQFYRFKRREYVLASRSLGASDLRLIYRHILPNGLGTIITSSVLMIPSVIYSEASLAYLGLGLQDITSLGTIIQNNQNMISTAGSTPDLTYLILFPSIVLALLLICFELFGQGLRDAVNPNTKGLDD